MRNYLDVYSSYYNGKLLFKKQIEEISFFYDINQSCYQIFYYHKNGIFLLFSNGFKTDLVLELH